jgi:serine protease Do
VKGKFALVGVLLLLFAVVLAGCSQPSLNLKGTVLQPSVSQASSQETTSQAAQAPDASQVLDVLQNRLSQIYDQVNPSVVNIQMTLSSSGQSFDVPSIPGMPSLPNQTPRQHGLASGFVWDTNGYIVTNNHVVDGASEVTVTFYDGTTVSAKVVGTDPNSDLAVIKVDLPADQLHPIQVADSAGLKVGQLAVAIGNPFGLEGTMTVGFVSALNRSLPVDSTSLIGSYTIPDIIQTDAPINPGNSGGVLVNDKGQLIGVPTAIESSSGSNSGIGFAVPSAIVQKVVPALIDKGAVEYSWLGITGLTLTSDLAEAMSLGRDQRGVLVIQVTADSPAEKAGLQGSAKQVDLNGEQAQVGGDVITAIGGQPVKQFEDLATYLVGSTSVGDKVALTILRDGKEQTVEATLAARPATSGQTTTESQQRPEQGATTGGWLGIQGTTLTPEIAQAMDLSSGQEGVLVVLVTSNSPAEKAGVQGSSKTVEINGQQVQVGGDVITAIDGQSVSQMGELRSLILADKPGQQVTLTILRGGKEITVQVTLGERPTTNP